MPFRTFLSLVILGIASSSDAAIPECITKILTQPVQVGFAVMAYRPAPKPISLESLIPVAEQLGRHNPALGLRWEAMRKVDEGTAAWIVNKIEGIELLPLAAAVRLARHFHRPIFRYAIRHTWGRIRIAYRHDVAAPFVHFLRPKGVVGDYFQVPFHSIMVLASHGDSLDLAVDEIIRSFARRMRVQLGKNQPLFSYLDDLYKTRMEALELTSEQYRRWFWANLQEPEKIENPRDQAIHRRLESIFLSPIQAWNADHYYAEGVVLFLNARNFRMRRRDPELFNILQTVFGEEAPCLFERSKVGREESREPVAQANGQ